MSLLIKEDVAPAVLLKYNTKVDDVAVQNAVGSYPYESHRSLPRLFIITDPPVIPPFPSMETRLLRHRSNADKICVVEDGRVVETGKHDELIKIPGGKYFQLVKLQMGTGTDG